MNEKPLLFTVAFLFAQVHYIFSLLHFVDSTLFVSTTSIVFVLYSCVCMMPKYEFVDEDVYVCLTQAGSLTIVLEPPRYDSAFIWMYCSSGSETPRMVLVPSTSL